MLHRAERKMRTAGRGAGGQRDWEENNWLNMLRLSLRTRLIYFQLQKEPGLEAKADDALGACGFAYFLPLKIIVLLIKQPVAFLRQDGFRI